MDNESLWTIPNPARRKEPKMNRLAFLLPLFALVMSGCVDRNKAAAIAQKRNEGLAARKSFLESRLDDAAKASVPDGFYDYEGQRDWYRMPLVFPYELSVADTTDILWLHRHNGKGPVSDPNRSSDQVGRENPYRPETFSRLSLDDSMLLFQSSHKSEFGLLLFSSGKFEFFASETELFDAARRHGYTGPSRLFTATDFYDGYWKFETPWIVIPTPAAPSPAEETHAESAESAESRSHGEGAE